MFYWIYDVPTPKLAGFFALSFVLFSVVGCLLIRPLLRMFVRSRSETNDVVGYVLSCFSVIYGILLGLLAVAVYQNFSQVELNVTNEAAALAALHYDFAAYPEPHRQELRVLLKDYVSYVIEKAWPLQRQGIVPKGGIEKVVALQKRLLEFQPQTTAEQIIHAETLHQFNEFIDHRRLRLHSVTTGIPAVMWYVVIVGSIINIAMIWLFDMKFMTHLILGGLFAFFLGTMIFLIAAMDNPFRGEVGVSSDSYELVLELIEHSQ